MEVTRRQFIQSTGVVLGAAGLGLSHGNKVLKALTQAPSPAAASSEKLVSVFTPCAGCHQKCVLRVHVVDGRIVKNEAWPFADQPDDTHCCVKGISSAALPYYPDRLKYPMKRAGNRGEGKWTRISWNEALDTIAQKLKETRDKYGSQAVLIDHTGSSVTPQAGDVNSGAEAIRFENLFGSTLPDGWYDDTSCVVGNYFTTGNDLEGSDPRGMMQANLIMVWGANPAESAFRDWKHITLARQKGVPVIVIGHLFDPTAAKADQFVPIKRATDAALALAMIQVIVASDLQNKAFLRQNTVAPLLVRDDNGKLLREADIKSDGSPDKFVAWDQASQAAVIVEKGKLGAPDTVALTGAIVVNGVACHTSFQQLVDLVNAQYTPEKAAEITGVPADTIRDLA